MAGNYELHVRTLPQVSGGLQIDGNWPELVTVRRGWGKAQARPWNDLSGDGTVRLLRGNSSFLEQATSWVLERIEGRVLSPALYRSGARVWERAGFVPLLDLMIMEKQFGEPADPTDDISRSTEPDLDVLEAIDGKAFEPFWHMSRVGIQEALDATPSSAVLVATVDDAAVGYAIVGNQIGLSFLQRIAVDPAHAGQGIGGRLLDAAERWAMGSGTATLVLNVRPDNPSARSLYLKKGFVDTGNRLQVLQYGSTSPIP